MPIDDRFLRSARLRMRERGRTLGCLVERALRRELARPQASGDRRVRIFDGSGVRPGVDLRSNCAMRQLLDEGQGMGELRE